MGLGENIRKRRKALGLTLEEVAGKLGTSKQTIQRYESGQIANVPNEKIERLADALEATKPEKAAEYRDAAEYAKAFVLSMYDPKLCCFYTGTEEDGITVSDGVIPLDTNSLAILAMWGELENPEEILAFAEERMAVGEGYDFSAGDLDGVWNEGTAQMAVCYYLMGNTEKYQAIMAYLQTQTAKDGSIPAADRDGLSTGFVIAGSDMLWEYNNEQSIGATCWLAFAQLGVNPFDFGAQPKS